jgi:lipopolysaccharide heptosyltransferase I
MNASPKILIIRLSSLGDILHALPAFSNLRATFPDSRIDWLVAQKCSFLPAAVRGIDTLHVLDTSSLLRLPVDRQAWNQFWNLIRKLRACHFDYVLDLQGLLKTAALGSVTGSSLRIGFSKELVRERPADWFYNRKLKGPQNQVHVLVLNQMLAKLAGARPGPYAVEFTVPAGDDRYIESLLTQNQLKEFVVLNPGGGWPTKRWNPENYGRLAKRIQQQLGLPAAVTTGPGEDGLFQAIAASSGAPFPRHLPVSFLQLIPLLKKARLFIGGDTGPFHLACALGTAVVGIFGPTSTVRNGPWRNGDEVIARALPCGSCYCRSCTRNNECMDISVDEVFAGVIKRLGIREGAAIASP